VKQCEFNGLVKSCDLNCSSIPSDFFQDDDGIDEQREGAFCVVSPEDLVDDGHTCEHCEEILEEDEPICGGDALNCMNGGVYEIDSISLPVLVPVDSTKRPTVP